MNNTTLSYLIDLHEASRQGRLVVFVGAGVSANSGVPTWRELISALKNDLPDNLGSENDDLKIAQIYKDTRGYKDYLKKVKTILKDGRTASNILHKAILQLNPAHIITTNYDDLLEQAIRSEYKQYDVVSQDKDLPYYRYPQKLVKMHGDFKTGNIVLSEEDYYNYSTNFPLIRAFVSSLFATNIVLFVGFSFDDLNLKIILNDLKNILDKNMQRVYLLTSNDNLDYETRRYYEQKGVNVVNIPNPEEYESKYHIDIDYNKINGISDPKGILLYRQLQIIKQIDTEECEDIVSALYNSLYSIQSELTTLGDGIKYLFPSSERRYWNLYSHGLQMDSPAIKSLGEQLKTFDGRKEFVKKHPKSEREFLKEQALMLSVYQIDAFKILSDYDLNHSKEVIEKYITVDDFYDLDFNTIIDKIKIFSNTELFYDKRDIILPYLLCRIGRFYDAYLIYKKRIDAFWQRELYVLYFISLYNLYNIRYKVQWETLQRADIDSDAIVEELDNIDLESTLVRLPISDVVKKTLADLCYNRIFSENAKEAEVLSEKLHKQRKQSERGGASQNSNIYALKTKFWRVFTFCLRNCIEYNNSYFGLHATATISGILNSHATKDTKVADFFESTRFEALGCNDVFILLSFIGTKELNEILSQYEINDIKITDEAVTYLSEIVNNFHSSSFGTSLFGEKQQKDFPFPVSYISYIFSNLLLLVSKCSTLIPETTLEKIYELVHRHKSCLSYPEQIDVIRKCVYRKPPSREVAITLLHDCLELGYAYRVDLIKTLSSQLAKSNYHYENQINFDYLTRINGELGMAMYKVLQEDVQKRFIGYMFKNCNNLLSYIKLIDMSQTVPAEQIKLKELLDNYKTSKRAESDGDYLGVFWYLVELRKSNTFKDLHEMIDSFGINHAIYRFLIDPLNYNKFDEIEPKWVILCPDEVIRVLLKEDSLKQKIKDYIRTDATGKLYFEKIYKLL